MYAAYMQHLAGTKDHKKVMSLLDTLLNSTNGGYIKPGISCFSSCILSAIRSGNCEDVVKLEVMMRENGIAHNISSFQGVLIANSRLGRTQEILTAVKSALELNYPMDSSTFMLCMKYFLPELIDKGGYDIESIRTHLRSLIKNSSVSREAIELSKSLKSCLREDNRKPSKVKNEGIVQSDRNSLWRSAVGDAMRLSEALERSEKSS